MIFIASDHAGFQLKGVLVEHLKSNGVEVTDCGPHEFDKADDYPDFVLPCAEKVARGGSEAKGIVLGYSGQGEAMAANKVKGVRAVLYYGSEKEIIKLTRQHNNANVLSLGANFLNDKEAKEVVDLWLETKYESGRHEKRLKKISDYEFSA